MTTSKLAVTSNISAKTYNSYLALKKNFGISTYILA